MGTRHEFGGELKDLETGICSMVDGSLYVLVGGEEAYYRASRSESNPHPTSFLFRPILNSDSASSPQLCLIRLSACKRLPWTPSPNPNKSPLAALQLSATQTQPSARHSPSPFRGRTRTATRSVCTSRSTSTRRLAAGASRGLPVR